MRRAFAETSLVRPDPPGRTFQQHVPDFNSEPFSEEIQWSRNVPLHVPELPQGSPRVAGLGPKAAQRDPPGAAPNTQRDVPRPPLAQPPLREQLSANVLARYDRLNLKVTHATIPAYTDADVSRAATTLGAGKFNTVFSVHLRNASGAQVEGVFKPLQPREGGWVAKHTGIPRDNPQIAMRNIATASYAEKLGFNVIAQTKVALITTPPTNNGHGGTQLGLLMERGQGALARHADASVMSKPQVLREVTKLQLLDHLTAQGDRHSNNYFVQVDAKGEVKVTGIDNDQCFGERATDPESIRYGRSPDRQGFRGCSLPPVVDHEMAIAINSLTTKDLQAMLGDKLSSAEVSAANLRLEGVQKHIASLDSQGFVIAPTEWGDPNVKQRLRPGNSYAGREISAAQRHSLPLPAAAQW